MKKLIILSLAICLFSSCYGQKLTNTGIQKIKNKRFTVRDVGAGVNEEKSVMIISNPDYKYATTHAPLPKVEYPFPLQKKDIYVDIEQAREIVTSVLKNKLPVLRTNSEYLSIDLSFNEDGEPIDIGYRLFRTTSISLEDIKKIDDLIKAKIKARFTGTDYLQYYVINYYIPKIIF